MFSINFTKIIEVTSIALILWGNFLVVNFFSSLFINLFVECSLKQNEQYQASQSSTTSCSVEPRRRASTLDPSKITIMYNRLRTNFNMDNTKNCFFDLYSEILLQLQSDETLPFAIGGMPRSAAVTMPIFPVNADPSPPPRVQRKYSSSLNFLPSPNVGSSFNGYYIQ